MSKAKLVDFPDFKGSTVTFICPETEKHVGATFKVCGMYNPSVKCPYRIRVRVYFSNSSGQPRTLEQLITPPDDITKKWTCEFTLGANSTELPANFEDVLISARLYNQNGATAISPVETRWAVYDSSVTATACTAECA